MDDIRKMPNIFLTEVKTLWHNRNFSFLLLTIAAFLLPLTINYSSMFLLLAVFGKLIEVFYYKKPWFGSSALRSSFLLSFLFFMYITLNWLVQSQWQFNYNFFEKELSKLAVLFLAPLLLTSKKEINFLMKIFLAGVLCAILTAFLFAIFQGVPYNRYAFVDTVDIHHTYLGMFILLLMNALIIASKQKKEIKRNWVIPTIVLILIFTYTLYAINSKVSMLSLLVLVVFHVMTRFTKKNALTYFIVLGVALSVFVIFNNKANISYQKALDFRLQIWEAGTKIFKQNMIFGELSQPEKDVLNFQHYLDGKYYFLDSDLNMHNQYLSFLMRFGIVGFLLFVLYNLNLVKNAFTSAHKKRLQECIGFAIILGLIFYTENILNRHHGIVFFSMFFNYYLIKLSSDEQES